MTGRLLVLTGASGFIGSAVLRRLAAERADGSTTRIRVVGRRAPQDPADYDEWTPADLGDETSLRDVCDGADTVLHLASVLGPDEAHCERVNVGGTTALMAAATRAGVRRIVQLSTAAVYGPGPHRGAEVGELTPAPVSVASRTRLAAERYALDAGAVVLRPGLVIGSGDRWVVPALAELRRRIPADWDEGRGLLSMVAVDDLARLVTSLARTPHPAPPGTVLHASHPTPVANGDLMAALTGYGLLPAVDGNLSWESCVARLHSVPGRVSERQFALLARDHWYRSERAWRLADCPPGPGPLARLAEAAPWYRSHLAAAQAD